MANTLATVRYGRYKTAAEADVGTMAAGDMRACVYDELSVDTWFYKIGGIIWKSGGSNATIGYALYSSDNSMNPTTRIGRTSTISVTSATEQTYEGNISASDNGPSSTACKGYAGNRYGIAVLDTVAGINHSMREAAAIAADNEQFYNRSGLSQPPPSSFGSYSSAIEGHMTLWATGYENVAPEQPDGLSPSGSITSLTPTFNANFNDKNGAYGTTSGLGVDTGDKMTTYRIRVRRKSDGLYLWQQTITATSAERAANQVSIAYAGTALVRGVDYEWRIQIADEFGEYSIFSDWTTFTPVSLGYITLDGTPTGKQEAITGYTFQGKWNHGSATSMKRVQIRITDDAGTVLQTGADYDIVDVASSALPGTAFSVSWANSGLANLNWGKSYKYQMKGYDGTNWSSWSDLRSFTTNAAPAIPEGLTPAADQQQTSYPLLACTVTDTDDTTATGLACKMKITRPDLSEVTVDAVYNAGTGRFEYQTTGVEITAYGTYVWTATGYDGTLYTGEQTLLANAVWANPVSFQYLAGAVVTLLTPTDASTVTTSEIDITWTSTNQVSYQVYLFADGSETPLYDSGEIFSGALAYSIPSGYVVDGGAYDIQVKVTDNSAQIGYSNVANITISFPPVDPPPAFSAVPIKISDDAFYTAIKLYWEPTSYDSATFRWYVIKRKANGGPDQSEIVLRRFSSPSITTYTDYVPASGYEYTYTIETVIWVGTDSVSSDRLTTTESITLEGVVLTKLSDGNRYRSCLVNVTDRKRNRQITETVYKSLLYSQPVTIRNSTRYWEVSLTGYLIDTFESTAKEKKEYLEDLDAQNSIYCYRDGRGEKRWVRIVDLEIVDEKPDFYSYTIKLREERVTEGTK